MVREIGRQVEIDVEARIDRAQVDLLARLDDEPPVAPRVRQVGENDLDGASRRAASAVGSMLRRMSHIEKLGVQLLERGFEIDPSLTPAADGFDDRLQLPSGFGETVFEDAGLASDRDARTMPAISSSFRRFEEARATSAARRASNR